MTKGNKDVGRNNIKNNYVYIYIGYLRHHKMKGCSTMWSFRINIRSLGDLDWRFQMNDIVVLKALGPE